MLLFCSNSERRMNCRSEAQMNENTIRDEQLNTYVRRTVASGIKPIELFLVPIYDCYGEDTVAYRISANVNSVIAGVLKPDDYLNSVSDEELLSEFSLRILKKTAVLKNRLEGCGINVGQFFVRFPSAMIYTDDIYAGIRKALTEALSAGNKLCIEFDSTVMDADSARLSEIFADIRAAGLKVAVCGYGGEGFPMEKLMGACPDFLFTDERVARLAVDREKRGALAPLINFAKSLGGEIIAENVQSDAELRELRTRECFGFIPGRDYGGALDVKSDAVKPEELIAQGEGND